MAASAPRTRAAGVQRFDATAALRQSDAAVAAHATKGRATEARAASEPRPAPAPLPKGLARPTARQVLELGATQLSYRDRRAREAQQLAQRGVPAPRGQKIPYKILMGRLAKQRRREELRAETLRDKGLQTPQLRQRRGRKRERTASPAPRPAVGRLANGVLKLSSRDVSAVTGGAKRPRRA